MDNKTTFDHLRHLAKLKRDQDIQHVKKAYKDRLAQIDTMQRELGLSTPATKQAPRNERGATQAAILDVIPDTPFTFDEIMASLAQTIDRMPTINYVRQIVRRMVKRGELKEVINKHSRIIKKYALPHVEADEPLPPLGITVSEILRASNAPMRPVEICVAMIESGNALDGDPTESVGLVLRVLRDHPDLFTESNIGYWKITK